jgi:hypothetical protein
MARVGLGVVQPLLDKLDELESAASHWQTGATPSQDEIRQVRDEYLAWYASAQRLIPDEKLDKFKNAYEGGLVIKRIRDFLSNPMEPNVLANPSDPSNPFGIYQHSFEDCFRASAAIQREILYEVTQLEVPLAAELERLADLLSRVPDYVKMLADAGAPEVVRESGLQDLLHPLLLVLYADVRREDLVPQFAGGGSRVDFLLKELGIVLETKMTRSTLTDKKVGEELLVDWSRYRKHPNCAAIFARIYDPGRYISNPKGLQADLTDMSATIPTCALIVR